MRLFVALDPPEAERLADLKRHDKYTFLMNLNSPDKVAGAMAHFVSLTGGIEGIDQFFTAMSLSAHVNIRPGSESRRM